MTLFNNFVFIVSFFFIVVLQSCNYQSDTTNEKSDKIIRELSIKLVPDDTVIIPISNDIGYNSLVELITINDKRFIGTEIRGKNKYQLYDLDKRKIYKTLSFDYDGPNGVGNIRYIKVINWDTIFIIQRLTKNMFLLDSSGKVLQKWTFNKTSSGKEIAGITARYIASPLKFRHNRLFFQKIPNYSIRSKNFWEDTTQLIYNIKTNELTNKVGWYPTIYKQGVFYGTYNMFADITVRNDALIVYGFSLDKHLFVYDSNRLIKTVSLPSQYFSNSWPTPKKDMFLNREYAESFEIQRGSYRFLYYDKYRDYILRLVLLPMKLYDKNNKMHKWEDKPFSIQIINKNFELIGEIKFPGERYYFRNIIPVKEGVLISYTNDKNPNIEENKFKFILYKYNNID